MKTDLIVAIGISAATIAMSGCTTLHDASTGAEQPLQIPQTSISLKAPDGHVLTAELRAIGVQIYECGKDKSDGSKYAWNFKAPEADLFETRGKHKDEKIGKHYGGPTWEGNDGSKVLAAVQVSENSPDVGAIAWLLLGAKSNSGDGMFARTTYVQRLETNGGKAPVDGCDQTHLGTQMRVPYTARYYFYH